MRRKAVISAILLILVSFFALAYFNSSKKVSLKAKTPQKEIPLKEADGNNQVDGEAFFQKILSYKSGAKTKLQLLEQQVNAKQAFDNNQWYEARQGFMRVIAEDPTDFQAWVFLSKILQEMKGYDEEYQEEFQAALIKAEHAAKDNLDKTLMQQFDGVQEPKVFDRLQTLLKMYPKEFAPYFLDIPQQTDIATACVSFTHPLLQKRDFHYEDTVTLTPAVKDLGVIARGNKLCLEGLQFGENYQLTFKEGFPGENNLRLEKAQSLDIFVPHRKPAIYFRDRGYILPSFGEQVIPFVAVNVPKVQVKIVHIPERNIQSIQGTWFSNQIGPWDFNNLTEEQGELIWQGTYFCESELNKTGVSGLPIVKMLGKSLQAGVYVVEARIVDESYESNEFTSQALIVSDIGLSTYQGPDGLHILARDLHTAKTMEGVQVSLIAKNNRELATGKTNNMGWVSFAAPVVNGTGGNMPSFLTAAINGKQFTVLNLRNEGFDLSDRGAKGDKMQGPLSAYVFTERGLYRPGEKVHLTSLLRQSNADAQVQVPLTVKIFRPDGVLAETRLLKDEGAGGYQLDYLINNAAPTGNWTVGVYLDPKSDEIGMATFEVHDFVPPRIEVKATASQYTVAPGQENPILLNAQYYFGAPGQDLKVEAESVLSKSELPFKQWEGYSFGLEEEAFAPLRFPLSEATTDSKGQATIDARIAASPQTTQLLEEKVTATVFEIGGRGQKVKEVIQYWHQPFAIGIKPRFKNKVTASNSKALFDLIAVNQKGELQDKEALTYTLYEEDQDYIWFRSGTQWQYELVVRDRVIDSGKVKLSSKTPSLLEVPVTSGLYRLEIADNQAGVATSVRFSAGWFYSAEAPDKPDLLELKVEKDKVFVKSPFAGEVFLAIAGQDFKPIYSGKIGKEGLTLTLAQMQEQTQMGGYLIGTVYRPGDIKTAQMPGRAIGVHWFKNEKALALHQIDLAIEAPKQVKSNQTMQVKVKVPANHKSMRVVAALVDEAVLSLDDYQSPDPVSFFFSQKELAYQLRDSYGLLINPFGAKPGSFEEGAGDGEDSLSQRALSKLPAKAYKVVSLFSGIVASDNQESLSIPFSIPEFSGKLRLMVVAWDEKGLGHAQSSILVRDPLDVYFVLPRFLAPGDKTIIPLVLRNLDAKEGEYTLRLSAENNQIEKKIILKKDKEARVPIDLTFNKLGLKALQLKLEGPDNFTFSRSYEISVRPKVQSLVNQKFGTIEPQKALMVDASILKNLEATTDVLITLGGFPDFAKTQLTKELINYPYLCLEQTTSRMLAEALRKNPDKSTLAKGFSQLSSLQKIDGSFGLWSSQGQVEPWLSLYTSDVLNLMQKQELEVPTAIQENLANWRNELQESKNISLAAYASYLNAKEGKGSLGALRYFVETNPDKIILRRDLAFIAAAFAYYNEPRLAEFWFNKAIATPKQTLDSADITFGSDLRDTAILVTLLAETTKSHPKLFELAHNLSAKANEARYFSTQEKAWLIRAASLLEEIQKSMQLSIGGQKVESSAVWQKSFLPEDLKNPIKITNLGINPIFYSLITQGEPVKIQEVKQQGFDIERDIYTMRGEQANLSSLKSGDNYVVFIQGKRLNEEINHSLLIDLLPAGFEIEDVNLLKDNAASAFPWLPALTPASRLEGRDDRFVGAYELAHLREFQVAYLVRAVSKGTFTYPAVYIEAMYQPQNFKYGEEQSIKIE